MANNHKNVIEINGKLYDTKHGVPVSHTLSSPTPVTGVSIDGFVVPKPQTIISPTKTEVHYPQNLKPIMNRKTAGHHKGRTQQKSSTLMRKAVKKPAVGNKAPEISGFSTVSRSHIRTDRANHSTRSPYINKYRHVEHQVVKRTEPIAVVGAPDHHHAQHSHASTTHTHHQNKSEKLFSEALQKAEPATKQKKPSKKRAKALGWSSGILAALLLIGFIAYLSLPNINVMFASSRAGFSATMPGYKPSGYTFNGPVDYEAGKVAISFKSNTDDRAYTVKQEVSNWNSQSLQENFLAVKDKTFTTSQEAGRTVYLYDNGSATWVNGGVWYQVESSSLSSDQLLSIASSM